ncbi:MAG: signal peptide peptidase SppA [archaeon]
MAKKKKPEPEKKRHSHWWVVFIIIVVLLLFFMGCSVMIMSVGSGSEYTKSQGNVALIQISGVLRTGSSSDFFAPEYASSTKIIQKIRDAENDASVKAIVLEINSPGGGAVASYEVVNELKKSKKPTVSWIREVGASGAYWIATSTDYIIANPMAVTGSIGVIGSYLEFGGLLERYNVTYTRLVSGKYKDIGTPYKELVPDEEAILQQKLDIIYNFFVKDVAANRNMEKDKVEELATGLFYLGVEAKDLGLIDQLGGEDEVKEYLKQEIGLESVKFKKYYDKRTIWDVLGSVLQGASFNVGRGMASYLSQDSFTLRT